MGSGLRQAQARLTCCALATRPYVCLRRSQCRLVWPLGWHWVATRAASVSPRRSVLRGGPFGRANDVLDDGVAARWPSRDWDEANVRVARFVVSLWFSDHLSHTTPSPSPALDIIHFGKPLPPPLLPCRRVSPAACASSQAVHVLLPASGSVVQDCWQAREVFRSRW